MTQAIVEKELSPIKEFFFYDRRDFLYQNGVRYVPTLTFLDQVFSLLYGFIRSGNGNMPEVSYNKFEQLGMNLVNSNENYVLDFNLQYFEKTLEISDDLTWTLLSTNISDSILRFAIILICMGVAMPMLYVSMQ